MVPFVYDIPTRVYFGENQLSHLGEELARFGRSVLLVYGGGSIRKNGLYDTVTSAIREAGMEFTELSGVEPNPKIEGRRAVPGASGGRDTVRGRRFRHGLREIPLRGGFP